MKSTSIKKILAKVGLASKPSFMILGAQKAGTTSMFSILNQHSFIQGSTPKEVHYFDNDDWYNQNQIIDYHLCFPLKIEVKSKTQFFEASPSYLIHPKVAERLYNYNPKLKFIVILREPVERAISAWKMYSYNFTNSEKKFLVETRDFKSAIRSEIDEFKGQNRFIDFRSYLKRGMYAAQIEHYLQFFPLSQFLFIESNDLKNQFEKSMTEILSFLELPWEPLSIEYQNESKDLFDWKENENIILELKEIFASENQKLFELLGKKYDWE